MKEIIAVINQKGGVGKSTTTQSIGAGIALKGYKVLYIDMDAQSNLSYTMGADLKKLTVLDLLNKDAITEQVIQHTDQGDIIPASPALAGADGVITATGKEYRLKEALEPVKDMYDYIVIDTPPALGILIINALTAASGVVIPAQADIYSLQGINQLHNTIQAVKQYCNPDLKVKGIVLTKYSNRTVLSREVAEMLEETAGQYEMKLYKSTIREAVAIRESQASQQNVFSYAPKSKVADDYRALVEEILERN